ncbi:MAG: squalene/phytoene synthase family protein [Actinomycetales bacterium]|nr:squalene/phytoene synthase family protein [Actinomycetales bacterium]
MNFQTPPAVALPQTAQSALYDDVAEQTAGIIIHRYSTSFGLASRLLAKSVRRDVANIYALVRLADEIVDGVASEAGADAVETRRLLDELEGETERAMASGYSTNLIVHAFALSARRTGIEPALTRPFFESMRVDITEVVHTPQSFDVYVYGSAEVVGLMCLRAFLKDVEVSPEQDARFVHGARKLGAAFQKVNFLRDLSADVDALGRSYFPGINIATFTEEDKARLVADIDADLAISAAIVPELPASSRRAVALAQNLFVALSRRIERTPASELKKTRVSVPTLVKARLALAALIGRTS